MEAVAEEPTATPPSEPAFVTTATGSRQQVFPADAPQYDSAWFTERERYLLAKGWEKDPAPTGMPTYRDPRTSQLRGEIRQVGTLPVKGDDLKKSEPVMQMHVPAAVYSFTLEEALDVQRRRDALGAAGPSPLDRLAVCEKRCNELEQKLEQFRARVKVLLTAHPVTVDGLRLGLQKLREE